MSKLEMLSLFPSLSGNSEIKSLVKGENVSLTSVESLALTAALAFHEKPEKTFYLFPSMNDAEIFAQFIGDYLDPDEYYLFPYDEIFRTSAIGVSPEMRDERLAALASIFEDKPSILIAHASSAMLSISPKERYRDGILSFTETDMFDLNNLLHHLLKHGYQHADRVVAAGQFARRGNILDIYDPFYTDPVRIEFFGDEIEDIRLFRVNDELSFKHIHSVYIHPASLRLVQLDEAEKAKQTFDEYLNKIELDMPRISFDELKDRASKTLDKGKEGYLDDIDMRFYSFFNREETDLLDYLDEYKKYVYAPDTVKQYSSESYRKEKEYFSKSVKSNTSFKDERVFCSKKTDLSNFAVCNEDASAFGIRENGYKSVGYARSDLMLKSYLDDGYQVRIVLPEPNLTNYKSYLENKNIAYSVYPTESKIMVSEGRLTHGFELPDDHTAYLSSKEIFGISTQKSKFLSRYKQAKIINKYEDLKVGDYVVHEVHGVGKYLGVTTLDGLEYLHIQYANDAAIYIPLAQYRMIRKYSSREGHVPTLDRIGGSTWERKKSKIRSKMSFLADQLLIMYSQRQSREGFAFPGDDELEQEFMDSFPYTYTKGQLEAIADVKHDMESKAPMDRLIAGDVGFGKTEIAFYATFKASIANKQTAFLCPTTILADQHYKVATERLAPFGLKIAVLSRFQSDSEKKQIISDLKEGKIDILIGTHSILSDSVKFKDLGLLIIDEEQRFGVVQKEKIKEKYPAVDSLTLSATPIPRTMQMSLVGIRSTSMLEEPPMNRMPVKTYVSAMDNELIYEVTSRELERFGQVYYLHNDIKSIDSVVQRLQKKFPDHTVKAVHARMDQNVIEETMSDFYEAKIDILVCTTIIESGLDIPNVNTIIVEDADHFGLAQLYQIKGRVGRSDRIAYAYFFFKNSAKMTEDAGKRLKALKDFAELGSGYKIAMQDLNIRGAGDILGSEQSGFVDSLGYDAYMDLLEDVMKEKQLAEQGKTEEKKDFVELSFSLDAHIPSDYGTESQRITMYRELSDCNTIEEVDKFGEKLKDVYGEYNEEVVNLLIKRQIEIRINSNMVDSFKEVLGAYSMTMSDSFSQIPYVVKKTEEKLEPVGEKIRIRADKGRLAFSIVKTKDYLSDLLFITEQLASIYDEK